MRHPHYPSWFVEQKGGDTDNEAFAKLLVTPGDIEALNHFVIDELGDYKLAKGIRIAAQHLRDVHPGTGRYLNDKRKFGWEDEK